VFPDTEMLSEIIWAHPYSVKLFNTFPTMLIMDSTYKTNKYRLPLLEFVGTTFTGKTYVIAFAFLTSEREENFVWELQSIHNLLRCPEDVKVIVTRDGRKTQTRETHPNPNSNQRAKPELTGFGFRFG
ncbi:FAR1-related protein, partial [Trifolium medium]|nr:FAR1-related protein [Trifolium medium]